MTINDLIKDLEDTIAFLKARFDSDQEVDVVGNTYFLKTKDHFLGTREGFIDLNNPVETDEEDW